MDLSCLILGWTPLIKVRVQHLMSDQLLLRLPVSQVAQVLRSFAFGIGTDRSLVFGHT